MTTLQTSMNDFKKISIKDKGRYRKWTVNDMRIQHMRESKALMAGAGSDIIVTHHIPHMEGINPQHTDDSCNGAYATDMSKEIETINAPLWIHGHSHGARDYRIGATTIANVSRGYPGIETSGFTEINTTRNDSGRMEIKGIIRHSA